MFNANQGRSNYGLLPRLIWPTK